MTAQTKQDELIEKANHILGNCYGSHTCFYNELPTNMLDKEIDDAQAEGVAELINSEVLSVLSEIKTPTINDVFPEKPYDGTNTYTDMKQVVDYYESQIQSIKNRYKL